jgi:peroxiredoxin Q/BCP
LQAQGAKVFGVNPFSRASHRRFRDKHRLPFPLLVDNGQRVAKLYKASGLWIKRTVYLIDSEGIIRYAKRGNPSVDEVLSVIR